MRNVIWLFEYPTLLGGERSLLGCLTAIRDAGFHVSAIGTAQGPLARELARLKVDLHPLEFCDASGSRRALADLRSDLREILLAREPHLLHANSLSTSRVAGPVAADLRVPSIGHLRDIVNVSGAAIADLNRHSKLLAVSNATRDFHVAAGLDATKTEVLYNGVELAKYCPRDRRFQLHDELQLPRDVPLIGAIGQIGLRKGFDVLLAAATNCRTGLHFVVIGERHSQKDESIVHERELHAVAEQAPLMGRVHFLGTRDDVDVLLPELTLLVHPARQEPLGRVLLEAAACGLPIIATDVGGTAEIFPPDDESAVLIPPDDPEALADTITDLLTDESRRIRLGRAAHGRMESHFDQRAAADNLIVYYDALAAAAT